MLIQAFSQQVNFAFERLDEEKKFSPAFLKLKADLGYRFSDMVYRIRELGEAVPKTDLENLGRDAQTFVDMCADKQ